MLRKAGEAEAALVVFDPDRRVEAARRDTVRFETLYRRYGAQIHSFAVHQLSDHRMAEDPAVTGGRARRAIA